MSYYSKGGGYSLLRCPKIFGNVSSYQIEPLLKVGSIRDKQRTTIADPLRKLPKAVQSQFPLGFFAARGSEENAIQRRAAAQERFRGAA